MTKNELDQIFGNVSYPNKLIDKYIRHINFQEIKPGDVLWVFKNASGFPWKGFYLGKVVSIQPNHHKFSMFVESFYGSFHARKRYTNRCANTIQEFIFYANKLDKITKAFLVRRSDAEEQADRRKQYASHRKLLYMVRVDDRAAFQILGISSQITADEFRHLRRKLMMQYHPDRQIYSGMNPEQFVQKSKQITDALSYVEMYLKKINVL